MAGRAGTTLLATILIGSGALPGAGGAMAQTFEPGATSLHDSLLPQIGNGGYDARHYSIELHVDPSANRLLPGTRTTMTAVATQNLSRLSLDFQRHPVVSRVLVDGHPAEFSQRDAKPRLSSRRKVTQPAKLIVTPAAGIPLGRQFSVEVHYAGKPRAITDSDDTTEGWVRACRRPGRCDGDFTANEPIGAESWFPSNNHPRDKATFTTAITAPSSHVALGAGELASRAAHADGTTTWTWRERHPTATYLTTATVGRFDFTRRSITERRTGVVLPFYVAIDSAASRRRRHSAARGAARAPSMLNFLAERFGPYPFASMGVVADWIPGLGYAIENQTKPHLTGDERGPSVPGVLLVHETAHQWMGDAVSPRDWSTTWFNEGWATFAEIYWDAKTNGSKLTPRRFFRLVHGSDASSFEVAPAVLDGDPANLFDPFAVYQRPAAMLEGFREIVGNRRFFAFARALVERHGYSTIGRVGFVREAKAASGLHGKRLRRVGAYFHQWLMREGRPDLTPADFGK